MQKKKHAHYFLSMGILLLLCFLLPASVYAGPDRQQVNKITASATNLSPVEGQKIPMYENEKPVFTVTQGSPAYFYVNSSNGCWQNYDEATGLWSDVDTGVFTEGRWRFKTQIRIDGSAGKNWVLGSHCDILVNHVPWEQIGDTYVSEYASNLFSYAYVASPAMTIKKVYHVTINDEGDSIDWTSSGTYNEGDIVILNFGQKDGMEFDYWSVDSGNVTLKNPYNPDHESFSMPAQDVVITAHWKGMLPIDKEHFPDDCFRYFIIQLPEGEDGYLSTKEIQDIYEIDCSNYTISDLTGLEYFTSLDTLKCSGNNLTQLDLSKCFSLTAVVCNENHIKELDTRGLENLDYLACENNQMTSLNVSESENLIELWCSSNNLTSLDLSKNKILHKLICDYNKLTTLNLDNNPDVAILSCGNNQLETLHISHLTLTDLNCANNLIKELDLSGQSVLSTINCENNMLACLNLENSSKYLASFQGSGNIHTIQDNISVKDVRGFDKTKVHNMTGGSIVNDRIIFDQGSDTISYSYDCTASYSMNAAFKKSSVPQIAVNKENFPDDNFRSFIKSLPQGKDGFLSEKDISEIDFMDCSQREIRDLTGIEYFTSLINLNCSRNELVTLDLSKNTYLDLLSCDDNKLTSIDISDLTLTDLSCNNNQLTRLDLSSQDSLITLSCNKNQLTSLNLPDGLTYATAFHCNDNLRMVKNHSPLSDLTGLNLEKVIDIHGGTFKNNMVDFNNGSDTITYTYRANPVVSFTFILKKSPEPEWVQDGNDFQYVHADGSVTKNNWELINGVWYFFDAEGWMTRGWLNTGGHWYYMDDNGSMALGWKLLGGYWYFFDGSGHMANGWLNTGGHWYFFDGSGHMVTGWLNTGGHWYFFDGSGHMVTGWLNDGGHWYFFDGSGHMAVGWASAGGKWYYFDGSGHMATGWLLLNGSWYYLEPDGSMVTGWKMIGGTWYQFDASGRML